MILEGFSVGSGVSSELCVALCTGAYFYRLGLALVRIPHFFRDDRNTMRKVELFSQPDFCRAENSFFPGQESGPMGNSLSTQASGKKIISKYVAICWVSAD